MLEKITLILPWKISKANIIKTRLSFLYDNVCIVFDVRAFKQRVGIIMGTNCAHFLAHLLINSN